MENGGRNNYLPKGMSELESNLDYPLTDIINQSTDEDE
jgi:hypothetical protein